LASENVGFSEQCKKQECLARSQLSANEGEFSARELEVEIHKNEFMTRGWCC
jgi:hypothetical protein